MPLGFLGQHEYRVDAKGRIPLPPAFRERLVREGGVMSPGLDGCIRIYPTSEWEKRTEELATRLDNTLKVRRQLRFANALSFPLAVDGQGRMALPAPLRQHADITDAAIVAGVGKFLEVWSKKRWESEKEIVIQESWQNSESTEEKR